MQSLKTTGIVVFICLYYVFPSFIGLEFTIGLPEDEFNRGALLTYLDENIDMENAMKEMMKNANPEYTQKSFSEGSPTDFADVRQLSLCLRKTYYWGSDQVRHKTGCTVTEAG